MSILDRFVDERFLVHRQRATSTAGMLTAASAILLFYYRYAFTHVANWDLLAVGVLFVLLKLSLMVWYAVRD